MLDSSNASGQPNDVNPYHGDPSRLVRAMSLTREQTNYANDILLRPNEVLRPNEELFKEFIIAATTASSCDEWDISFVGWKDRVARGMSEQFQLAGHPAKPQFGPDPSPEHTGIAGGNYPPQTDADAAPLLSLPGSEVKVFGYEGIRNNLSNPDNPCVKEAESHLPSAVLRRGRRQYLGSPNEVHIEAITLKLAFVDANLHSMDTPDSKWSKKEKEIYIEDQQMKW